MDSIPAYARGRALPAAAPPGTLARVSVPRRATVLACALASLALLIAATSVAASNSGAPAGKAKGKACKKGYVPKTITTKKGKKVKVCRKRGGKAKGKGTPAPLPAPAPAPAPAPVQPQGLFEAPGRQLNGEEAKPFLQKYLANSTFTDCVTGWPSCGGFENRYSHSSGSTFYQCWLRPTSGSDVKSVGEYGYKDARVEPDGSWVYKELVYWYGHYSLFEWSVSTTGVVTGAQLSDSGGAPESIGPLQYVGGIAKDCSY